MGRKPQKRFCWNKYSVTLVLVRLGAMICLPVGVPLLSGSAQDKNLTGQNFQPSKDVSSTSVERAYRTTADQLQIAKEKCLGLGLHTLGLHTYYCSRGLPISRPGFFDGRESTVPIPEPPEWRPREGELPWKGGEIYGPPFKAVPLERFWETWLLSWVPRSEAVSGKETLSRLEAMADRAELLNCTDLSCLIVVKWQRYVGALQETTLALCEIYKIGQTLGAPEACRPVALFTSEKSWLLAETGFVPVSSASLGLPDFTIKVFTVRTQELASVASGKNLDTSLLVAAVQDALKSPPLSLETRLATAESLVGIASFRPSPIIHGWRECVTIRVDLERHIAGLRTWEYSVTVSTTLYVNRLNTTRPGDWTLPTPQQEQEYTATVKSNLRAALNNACKRHGWRDDFNIDCETLTPLTPRKTQ